MRKVASEVFFYLTVLVMLCISILVLFYNGNTSFADKKYIVLFILFGVFYIIYGILTKTLYITKENYKNKNLYTIIKFVFVILLILTYVLQFNSQIAAKYTASLLGITFIVTMFIDRKQIKRI